MKYHNVKNEVVTIKTKFGTSKEMPQVPLERRQRTINEKGR
jgi:hypothetical protein